MIAINKAEKDAISAQFPNVHIVRTMKNKSKRHRYYCEESRAVIRYLNRVRGDGGVTNKPREGGYHTNRKNAKRVAT